MDIKFGTDGWRGLIARNFTFENIQKVALATARYLKTDFDKENLKVVIGYDTRCLSGEFAKETALVLASQGINVLLSDDISSTPQVSFAAKNRDCDLGVVITASHNPPEYNGYKVKASYGGPATPEQIEALELHLNTIIENNESIELKSFEEYLEDGLIELFNAKEEYLNEIKGKINLQAIKQAEFKILFDPMYGAGIDTLKHLIPAANEIHNVKNSSFGELDHPEPMASELGELMQRVKSGNYDMGLAADGDADRLGAVDNEGNFVDSHKIFMILLKYLYEKRELRGKVVKTVSLTSMVTKYCEKKGLKLEETPVGFKYIAGKMAEGGVLIGGEESGGLGTALHIPERDGIFNGLLLLEVMAVQGKTLKELCDELEDELGPHKFLRNDVRVTQEQKEAVLAACANKPNKLGDFDVKEIDTKDGYKFIIDDGWLLIRASGTEPLLRFYAEAPDMETVEKLIEAGKNLE